MHGPKTYFIKKPRKGRKSWAIVGYEIVEGKRRYFTPETTQNAVDVLNGQLRTLEPQDIRRQLEHLIVGLYKQDGNVLAATKHTRLSEDNHKVFERYWTEIYGAKEIEDPSSMRYDLLRALRLIEPHSILTSSAADLRSALQANRKNVRQHRRAVDRLNQLLAYLKRDVKLEKPKDGLKSIRYMSRPDFDQMLSRVDNEILRDLYLTLFGTGMRLGEALALEPQSVRQGFVRVDRQLTAKGVLKLPKREKVGDSVILDFAVQAVNRWAQVKDKFQYRTIAQTTIKKTAGKPLSVHDLRHSHAIYLLSQGASLTLVALNLRNRIEVCQRYYTGFSHVSETLDNLIQLLRTNN